MDPIIGQVLFQKKVDRISKNVWETFEHIGSLLEVKDDDSNNDFFYTLFKSLSKLIYAKLENRLDVDHGRCIF
jgi:hypothetical protein